MKRIAFIPLALISFIWSFAQNVGIGTLTPTAKLAVVGEGAIIINTSQTAGSNGIGINVNMNQSGENNIAIKSQSLFNSNGLNNHSVGIWGAAGFGELSFAPIGSYGIIGENRNASSGTGIIGISRAPATSFYDSQAGVVGVNLGGTPLHIGVAGVSNGIGVLGKGYSEQSISVKGEAMYNNTVALMGEVFSASNAIALELKNGPLKVSGARKTIFRIVGQTGAGGNISGNLLSIPTTSLANSANDLLIVTPVYESATSVYVNFPIGVWWDGNKWNIFNQTGANMPNGATFNVLVAKQ